MSEPHLEDLPEAIPLHRVAPAWRALAMAAFVVAGLLLALVVMLGISIAGLRAQLQATALLATSGPATTVTTAVVPLPEVNPKQAAGTGNLPYPVHEDLRADGPQAERADEEASSARARFLKKGKDWANVWQGMLDRGEEADFGAVAIAPDGQQIAYIRGGSLIAGPVAASQKVGKEPQDPVVPGKQPDVNEDHVLVGSPVWSADSRYVFYTDAGGRVFRYDAQTWEMQPLAVRGHSPAPVPGGGHQIVLVRTDAVPKVETPGKPAGTDLSEIVLWNLAIGKVRVVVPKGKATWSDLAVSPDGKRLAAISDLGHEGSLRRRLFLGDLADGKLRPVTPPASHFSRPCWTADGKQLVYARSQKPLPPDCGESPVRTGGAIDLFQYDLGTKQETRLSRGGGFLSPSLGSDGSLFYLTWKTDETLRQQLTVLKMTLAGAQQFGRKEGERPAHDLATWNTVLEQVCKSAAVPADPNTGGLTAELMDRVADQFARAYREQFRQEPPATEAALDRMARHELPALSWAPEQCGRLVLVLGAVRGEFLRRKGGAKWHLVQGPLTGKPAAENDSAFGYVFNPFLDPMAGSGERAVPEVSLLSTRLQADGRPLLLTNDPTAARTLLDQRASSGLTRGAELFEQGKAEEAEKVLLALVNQDANAGNVHLALRVGRLLYDHGRPTAVRELMRQRCARPPRDARQFNLLGLVQPEASNQAITAFKNALRCDLRFGPAYLNLAQTYQTAGDRNAARLCLKRYLELMPRGPLAEDAARRLAALGE